MNILALFDLRNHAASRNVPLNKREEHQENSCTRNAKQFGEVLDVRELEVFSDPVNKRLNIIKTPHKPD